MQTQTASTDTLGKRDIRTLLPLWRITGELTLKTPLSLGAGHATPITLEGDSEERYVISVARDAAQRPYIPASSLKGALNALAVQSGMDQAVRDRLFGRKMEKSTEPGLRETEKSTEPGLVEFCNLMSSDLPTDSVLPNWQIKNHSHTANLPHAVRDRDYGTAKDQLLFLEQVVPPDSRFGFECTARGADENDIAALLGLLQLAGADDTPLRLGGGKAADNGRISWQLGEIRRLASLDALWKALAAPGAEIRPDLWSNPFAAKVNLPPANLSMAASGWLNLPALELNFHTPFLCYERQIRTEDNKCEPHGKPRKNHHGIPILPAASLHGALRAQAERILRTLAHDQGGKTPHGYRVPGVTTPDAAAGLDLASILFGAPGWRSLLRIGDFAVKGSAEYLSHDMLAIDRLTGGGKEHAKFKVEALDCPTLTGKISLDTRRLGKLEKRIADQALGLLAHVLRDLDESDIALGYGAAKGYGRSTSATWRALDRALQSAKPHGVEGVNTALAAFAAATQALETGAPAKLAGSGQEPAAPKIANATGDDSESKPFHNPYVFIPFGTAKKDGRLPWNEYGSLADTHHSHARYDTRAFHGRLTCRLTTQTPIFIGAGDREKTQDPKQKENFKLDKELALPATSLRGMISSLHEAITRSALRVMDDRHYSVRATTEQSLPIKGKIVKMNIEKNGMTKVVWGAEDLKTGKQYPILPSAKTRLELLCDERTDDDETLPELKPPTARRNTNAAQYQSKLRLVEGQHVFFAEKDGKITEMAYSQIWRKLVADPATGNPWMTGMALPDKEMGELTEARTQLSPSELLFGCVQINDDKKAKSEQKIMAYASKVSFGFGRAAGTVKQSDDWITLKILASPKPPSPAMYFRPENQKEPSRYISKAELAKNPACFVLQGRKAYLHAKRKNGVVQKFDRCGNLSVQGSEPWVSIPPEKNASKMQQDNYRRANKQRVRVHPIEKGQQFSFDVDFANLSQAELESLCASLVPHDTYEHKLGMGKPIGLGSVKIEFAGMSLIDRAARYSDSDFTQARRYASEWKPDAPDTSDCVSPRALAQAQMAELERNDRAVFNAILLVGNPDAVNKPVHYPQLADQNIEEESFAWFVNNDKPDSWTCTPQHLGGFTENTAGLPTLHRTRRTNG